MKNIKLYHLLSPPGFIPILVGISFGLALGLLELSNSPERATAVGLTWFIGMAIGLWVGINVTRIILHILSRITAGLVLRARDVRRQFEELSGRKIETRDPPRSIKFWSYESLISANLLALPLFCIPACSFGLVLLMFLLVGLDIHPVLMGVVATASGGLALAGFVILVNDLWFRLQIRSIAKALGDWDSNRDGPHDFGGERPLQ